MDAMVTARVPAEVKEQVNALLREDGSSPTELVNSAYDYYLRHRRLPQERSECAPVCIALTPEQVEQVKLRAQQAFCPVPPAVWPNEWR